MKKHWISPSTLGIFKDCPRCFWLDRNAKISRPRGIFPSLPGGIDGVMKSFADTHRSIGSPIDGITLFGDQNKLNIWRNWRTGLKIESNTYVCGGAFDEVAVEPDGKFSPYDYKSKGSEPEDGYPEKYYQTQVDIYALMLEKNGMPTSGNAYFRFVWPVLDLNAENGIVFKAKTMKITTDLDRAQEILDRAAACLSGPIPKSGEECEYCSWLAKRAIVDAGEAK